jgi:hypothetical protein
MVHNREKGSGAKERQPHGGIKKNITNQTRESFLLKTKETKLSLQWKASLT